MWKKSTVTFWSDELPAPTEAHYERLRPAMKKALREAMGREDLKFEEIKHKSPTIYQDDDGEYRTDWSKRDWAMTMHARVK